MKSIYLLLVTLLMLGSNSWAKPAAKPLKKLSDEKKRAPQQYQTEEEMYAASVMTNSNCRITVTSLRHSEVSDVQQFFSQVSSKEECERKAKPHRHNLYPDQIKAKSVIVKFVE